MKFDKSRVYTALNADEVKVGSLGFVADNLYELENNVTSGLCLEDKILSIEDKYHPSRFVTSRFIENDDETMSYNLFYLIQEPEEKKFRPYKDTDEMIEDFKRRYNSYGGWSGKDNPMYNPLIWIKDKGNIKYLINLFGTKCVHTDQVHCSVDELLVDYTYLDGSPCGIEEI